MWNLLLCSVNKLGVDPYTHLLWLNNVRLKTVSHPATIYNEKRRILFSTVHNPKKGFEEAYRYLEGYKTCLGPKGYVGLKAELKFYETHRKEFGLTAAGDMGEHADFSGVWGSAATRFDVTTNLDYKKLHDYEPFIGEGPEYRIACLDSKSFEVVEMVSLAFRRCTCGGLYLPYIAMGPENFDAEGVSRWTHDQFLFETCTDCAETEHKDTFTHSFMPPPTEYASDLPEDLAPGPAHREYSLQCFRYFRRQLTTNIVALAERRYEVTGRRGDGHWTWDFPVIRDFVSSSFHSDPEIGLPT